MPFNQQLKSGYLESNNVETKRGIFRNRTHASSVQNVRPKLANNAIAMKPDRRKFQSKILNRKQPDEPNLSAKRSQSFTLCEQNPQKIVERPSICLLEKCVVSDECQVNYFPTNNPSSDVGISKNAMENPSTLRQNLVVNSMHSILFKMEHSKVDNAITNIVQNVKKDLSKPLKEPSLPLPKIQQSVELPRMNKYTSHIQAERPLVDSSSMHDELKIGDNIKLVKTNPHIDVLLESELKVYNEHLRKYDQEAKDVIEKFTASLEEKGKTIRKYEEDLSLFNSRVFSLQLQLEQSLERTRQLESTVTQANCLQSTIVDSPHNDLKSENEELKKVITNLETKLAKRDLHISNLKQVLGLETNKIKQLNNAQEEIVKLQRESIDKSQEINILRDQLKYETNMRAELMHEYDEKISKLKKLLAIREFLLMKERTT